MSKPTDDRDKKPKELHIKIDRVEYETTSTELTGTQLRQLATPDIGADRDLFEVVPGQPDRKVADTDTVEISNGKRFFTAPAHINPGARGAEA